jgi:CheY-like chemotaxis protein
VSFSFAEFRPASSVPLRTLVVNDEPDIRELLAITLGRIQITTDTAGDYASAVRQLGGGYYSLVLADMRPSDRDGPDFVESNGDGHPPVGPAKLKAFSRTLTCQCGHWRGLLACRRLRTASIRCRADQFRFAVPFPRPAVRQRARPADVGRVVHARLKDRSVVEAVRDLQSKSHQYANGHWAEPVYRPKQTQDPSPRQSPGTLLEDRYREEMP